MSWLEILLTAAFSLGAIIWGACLCHQRGGWLLAGWNTMPREAKAQCDKAALLRLYGRCVIGCGVGLIPLLCGSFAGQDVLLCIGLGIVAAMVALSIAWPALHPEKYRKRG